MPFLQSAFASSKEDERNPFRVGLLATSYEVERCVDYNTVILYSQVKLYLTLLISPLYIWIRFFYYVSSDSILRL